MAQRGRTKPDKRPAVMAAGIGQSPFDEHYGEFPDSGVTGNSDVLKPEDTNVYNTQDEIALVRRATEVLGIEHVARWMQSNIPSLGNQTPYALMTTEEGRKRVERVLLKIEHGVY